MQGPGPNAKMVAECKKRNGRGGFLENDADGGVNGDKDWQQDEHSRRQSNNNLSTITQSMRMGREWRI